VPEVLEREFKNMRVAKAESGDDLEGNFRLAYNDFYV